MNLFTLLGVAFIVMKILGLIDWSWLWVLSPIWIGFIYACVFGAMVYLTKK